MDWVIFGVIGAVLIALGIVAQVRGWIDMTGKHAGGRGGGVAGLVGGVDEVFAPMKYEASKIQEAQREVPAPAPLPGDGDKNVYKGDVKIDVSKL